MIDRSQFRIFGFATLLAAFGLVVPAAAQMAGPGGLGGSLGPINAGHGLHARSQPQAIAPPALPGASGAGNISAGPVANAGGDPTKLLFAAINHGDYTQARAAVSRGADLNAHNALGETPIELAVELNRNQITFMLLSVRAEEQQPVPAGFTPVVPGMGHSGSTTHGKTAPRRPTHPVAARPAASRPAVHPSTVPDNPGTPDPTAGFLGFGGKN